MALFFAWIGCSWFLVRSGKFLQFFYSGDSSFDGGFTASGSTINHHQVDDLQMVFLYKEGK